MTAFVALLIAAGVILTPSEPSVAPPVRLGFQMPRKGGAGPELDARRGGKLEVRGYDKMPRDP
jgi:hypothetical protein